MLLFSCLCLQAVGSQSSLLASRQTECDFCIDGPYNACPDRIYNPDLNADNVVEFDVDMDVLYDLRKDFETDVEPNLGFSTDDICAVDPYSPQNAVWNQGDNVFRSNAKWYSPRNKKTYDKYLRHVQRMGIPDLFQGKWIDAENVTVYGTFFLVRSDSRVHHMHWDWQYFVHTQLVTVLVPIRDINIHMAYLDKEKNMQKYEYKVGKGVGFAGGFMHSTDTGFSETDDVLFCAYLGGYDPYVWSHWQDSSADELEYYMHPEKGYIVNERYPDVDNCNPQKWERTTNATTTMKMMNPEKGYIVNESYPDVENCNPHKLEDDEYYEDYEDDYEAEVEDEHDE